MKSLMCSQDKNDPNVIHDVQFFKDMDAFIAHTAKENMDAIMGFMAHMHPEKPPTGVVYGGWDQRAVDMTKGFGA